VCLRISLVHCGWIRLNWLLMRSMKLSICLHHPRMYDIPKTRTVHFAKSFLPYSLVNFMWAVFLVIFYRFYCILCQSSCWLQQGIKMFHSFIQSYLVYLFNYLVALALLRRPIACLGHEDHWPLSHSRLGEESPPQFVPCSARDVADRLWRCLLAWSWAGHWNTRCSTVSSAPWQCGQMAESQCPIRWR